MTPLSVPEPGSSWLEALDSNAYPFLTAIGEAESAIARDVLHVPSIGSPAGALSVQSASQIGAGEKLAVFERPAEPVSYDEPAWLACSFQWISGAAVSCGCHLQRMPNR